jgi:hypothetical protein
MECSAKPISISMGTISCPKFQDPNVAFFRADSLTGNYLKMPKHLLMAVTKSTSLYGTLNSHSKNNRHQPQAQLLPKKEREMTIFSQEKSGERATYEPSMLLYLPSLTYNLDTQRSSRSSPTNSNHCIVLSLNFLHWSPSNYRHTIW